MNSTKEEKRYTFRNAREFIPGRKYTFIPSNSSIEGDRQILSILSPEHVSLLLMVMRL